MSPEYDYDYYQDFSTDLPPPSHEYYETSNKNQKITPPSNQKKYKIDHNKKISPKFNNINNKNNYGVEQNYYDMDPLACDVPNEWDEYDQDEYFNYFSSGNRMM